MNITKLIVSAALTTFLIFPALSYSQQSCSFEGPCKPKIEKTVVPYNKQAKKANKKVNKTENKLNKFYFKREAIDEHFQAKLAQIAVAIVAATIDCGLGVQQACQAVAKLVQKEVKVGIKWDKKGDKIQFKVDLFEDKYQTALDNLDCACNTLAAVYALCPSNIPAAAACPEL